MLANQKRLLCCQFGSLFCVAKSFGAGFIYTQATHKPRIEVDTDLQPPLFVVSDSQNCPMSHPDVVALSSWSPSRARPKMGPEGFHARKKTFFQNRS